MTEKQEERLVKAFEGISARLWWVAIAITYIGLIHALTGIGN